MKKVLFLASFCAVFLFNGCGENSPFKDLFDNVVGNFTGGLLQGQGLTASFGPLPEGSADVLDLEMNGTIVSGGSLMFKVQSEVELSKLYIQIKGANGNYEEDGYYALNASDVLEQGTSNPWVYNVVVQVSQDMEDEEDLIVRVSALTASGSETRSREKVVETLEVGSGALQISLSWNNYDDLDLWVLPPGGDPNEEWDWIFYQNKKIGNGYLDLDALGCNGHEQNENIYFESPLEDGEYIVEVELYNKCSSLESGASYNVSTFNNGKSFKISGDYQGKFEDSDSYGKRKRIGTITVSNNGTVVR